MKFFIRLFGFFHCFQMQYRSLLRTHSSIALSFAQPLPAGTTSLEQ
ncbi:MAG: hypothetical protein ACI9XB_005137 [Gammaproteobacteria bacterium]|jgi:hypothetical protein